MTYPNASATNELDCAHNLSGTYPIPHQANTSAVSWGAIVAGAAAIAALSLILLILGTGLGLSSVSPWAYNGVNATTFGVSTILWLTFTQIAASGMGGYLAGRLRTKWISVHTDEVHFRDTAHGFLAWSLASLVTAALLTSVIGSIVNSGVQAGASVVGVATNAATGTVMNGLEEAKSPGDSGSMGYYVDSLFRKDINFVPAPLVTGENGTLLTEVPKPIVLYTTAEVARIFMNSIHNQPLPLEDIRYVGQVVSLRTGLTQAEAEKRVEDTYARVQAKLRDAEIATKAATDKARKASAYVALWLFISLLIGAFVASLAATVGGRQRDQ